MVQTLGQFFEPLYISGSTEGSQFVCSNSWYLKSCVNIHKNIPTLTLGLQVQSQLKNCIAVLGLMYWGGGLGGLPPFKLETQCQRHGQAR